MESQPRAVATPAHVAETARDNPEQAALSRDGALPSDCPLTWSSAQDPWRLVPGTGLEGTSRESVWGVTLRF